jgi:hypothetical protein
MPGHKILAVVRTELRLLLRRPGFWLYVALLGALSVAVVASAFDPHDWLRTLVFLVNNLVFFQFPLVALLAGSSVARNRHGTGEWLWSTTLESPLLAMGQLLGLALGLCAALLIPVALAAPLLAFRGGMALHYLPIFGLYALALLLPTTLLELSVASALALWLRHTVLVALLAAGANALLWLGVLMPTATLFTPLNHTLLTLYIDPVAGLGAERRVLWPLFSLYMAASITLLALSVWGQAQIDRRVGWHPRHSWRVWGGAIAGATGLLLASLFYQRAVVRSTVPAPVTDQAGTWSVVSASHTGVITGSTISVDARLKLRNLGDTEQSGLVLALNPGLQVRHAAVNEQASPVQREGEVIHLTWPHSMIRTGEEVQVDLAYGGSLYLLREDYSLATSTRGQNPTAFRRPVRSYLDSRVIFLARDGDWRVWPLAAGAHLASEGNQLLLTVRSSYPLLSSGVVVEQHQDGITCRWPRGLPQFLLAAGPYRVETVEGDTVLLAPMGGDRDAARATDALALRQALAEWLEESADVAHQVVVLPYATDIVLGGTVIGLPAAAGRAGQWRGLDDSALGATRHLAGRLSRAWLKEHIAWPRGELETAGQLRSFTIEFEPPDETGHQRSTVRSLGGINPQAPAGRLIEADESIPLLGALSIILGQQATLRATDDRQGLVGESELWATLASAADASPETRFQQADLLAKSSQQLSALGLLPPHTSVDDSYRLASLVIEVDRLRGALGNQAFASFLQELAARHPAGGQPLAEDLFWQLARECIGN